MTAVRVDLRLMKQMHPRLPASTAADIVFRAGLAFQRRGHEPGVELGFSGDLHQSAAEIFWDVPDAAGSQQVDQLRVTEDGAEAVALALTRVARGWVVARRFQRGESADWLLTDPDGHLVALEVSGIDGAPEPRRLDQKLAQVAKADASFQRSACVVAFGPPSAALATL